MQNRSIECGNDFFSIWWDYEFYFCFIYIFLGYFDVYSTSFSKGNPLFDIQGFSIQF